MVYPDFHLYILGKKICVTPSFVFTSLRVNLMRLFPRHFCTLFYITNLFRSSACCCLTDLIMLNYVSLSVYFSFVIHLSSLKGGFLISS